MVKQGEPKEFRVFGPPGTGKTTYVSRQVQQAAKKFGKDNVIVASFTRTASAEIAGRGTGLPQKAINTLHGHAYQSLGKKEIAENHIKDFNVYAPQFKLSAENATDTEEMAQERSFKTQGDEYFSELQTLRAKMVPPEMYPRNVKVFAEKWNEFKNENDYVDFTDMIEIALENSTSAPFSAKVGFFDEVQDFTPLELALVRKWGSMMDYFIMAGDDDQTIFSFKGATPDAFLSTNIPDSQIRVLNQSYRVPRKVQEYAERIIGKVEKRQTKEYKPKDEEGKITYLPQGNFKNPGPILNDVEKKLKEGKKVMILTSCSYMLEPLKKELKKRGLPFHNPFRVKRGDWNPLRRTTRGTSSVDRLLAYLRLSPAVYGKMAMLWRFDDVPLWTEHINGKNVFKHGAKKWIKDYFEGQDELRIEDLMPIMHDEALQEILSDDSIEHLLNWHDKHVLATKKKAYEFPKHVLKQNGPDALKEEPKLIIGSIHSVKGGQADVVYLFPDLSISGMKEYQNLKKKDSTVRLMYVGATRAAQELIICPNATPYTFRFPRIK
jgi:DNA helicase II / ATP-dependent DNA helicase PcrA